MTQSQDPGPGISLIDGQPQVLLVGNFQKRAHISDFLNSAPQLCIKIEV